jgi:hypothetical protein
MAAFDPERRIATPRLRCACGLDHGDGAALEKLGWQPDFRGSVLLFVRCDVCRAKLVVAMMVDASICVGCHRIVRGGNLDVKVCASGGVFCLPCDRRGAAEEP